MDIRADKIALHRIPGGPEDGSEIPLDLDPVIGIAGNQIPRPSGAATDRVVGRILRERNTMPRIRQCHRAGNIRADAIALHHVIVCLAHELDSIPRSRGCAVTGDNVSRTQLGTSDVVL